MATSYNAGLCSRLCIELFMYSEGGAVSQLNGRTSFRQEVLLLPVPGFSTIHCSCDIATRSKCSQPLHLLLSHVTQPTLVLSSSDNTRTVQRCGILKLWPLNHLRCSFCEIENLKFYIKSSAERNNSSKNARYT
jgi:hypothetical protein